HKRGVTTQIVHDALAFQLTSRLLCSPPQIVGHAAVRKRVYPMLPQKFFDSGSSFRLHLGFPTIYIRHSVLFTLSGIVKGSPLPRRANWNGADVSIFI